jgi:hypothetical protein
MAETYTGHVHNVVVFDQDPPPLAEGATVHVYEVATEAAPGDSDDPMAPTRKWLLDLARRVERDAPDLPSDLAARHDHYAHRKPRP